MDDSHLGILLAKGAAQTTRRGLVAVTGAILSLCANRTADAACAPLPYSLQNGQTADASQVMADLNGILNCPLLSSGVGINTSTPSGALDVNGQTIFEGNTQIGKTAAPNSPFLLMSGYGENQIYFDAAGANWGVILNPSADHWSLGFSPTFGIGTLGTSVLTWTASGDVGIGTSAPTANLYVNGTTFSTTGWSTASDGRLKRDIHPIGDALSLVERLQGVRFKYLPADQRPVGQRLALPVAATQIGFVAQAVQRVVPEAVSAPQPGEDGVYGLDPGKLIPILVEAVKEQQAEIDALKAQVSQLSGAPHSGH